MYIGNPRDTLSDRVHCLYRASQVAIVVKNTCQWRRHKRNRVPSLGQEDPMGEGMATHSCILAWRIPWTEEPGGLQCTGLQSGTTEWLAMHTHRVDGPITHLLTLAYLFSQRPRSICFGKESENKEKGWVWPRDQGWSFLTLGSQMTIFWLCSKPAEFLLTGCLLISQPCWK